MTFTTVLAVHRRYRWRLRVLAFANAAEPAFQNLRCCCFPFACVSRKSLSLAFPPWSLLPFRLDGHPARAGIEVLGLHRQRGGCRAGFAFGFVYAVKVSHAEHSTRFRFVVQPQQQFLWQRCCSAVALAGIAMAARVELGDGRPCSVSVLLVVCAAAICSLVLTVRPVPTLPYEVADVDRCLG